MENKKATEVNSATKIWLATQQAFNAARKVHEDYRLKVPNMLPTYTNHDDWWNKEGRKLLYEATEVSKLTEVFLEQAKQDAEVSEEQLQKEAEAFASDLVAGYSPNMAKEDKIAYRAAITGYIAGSKRSAVQLGEWQLCPKCEGQGQVVKPPYLAAGINEWSSSQISWVCDVCNGAKTITRPLLPEPPIQDKP